MPKQGREYTGETVWRAQELYCVVRLTFDQVAEETGVSVSTLKRWGKRHAWRDKRDKLAEAESNLRADTILARSAMLKELIETKDPQVGFAVTGLEGLALKQAEAARTGKVLEAAQGEQRVIRTKEEAVAALKEAIGLKVNLLLHSPNDLDFKDVDGVVKALKLVRQMEPEGKKPGTGQSVSGDNIERMLDALR